MSLIEYKEISASQYTRCRSVNVINPKNATPTITFTEEKVTEVAGQIEHIEVSNGFMVNFDPNEVFDVINPLTGEPTGTQMMQVQVYAILYSAWVHHRNKQATHSS